MLCSDVPQPSLTDLAGRPAMTEADLLNLNRRQFINKATMGAASCIVCHSKMNELLAEKKVKSMDSSKSVSGNIIEELNKAFDEVL